MSNEINELMGTVGYIEKPTYLEGELQKAIDVVVDELISPPPEQGNLTVPEDVYNKLQDDYDLVVVDLADSQNNLSDSEGDVAKLKAEVTASMEELDAAEILRAAAENSSETVNNRYQDLLIDFQQSLQKGIKESIERVSLEAQVRGLTAIKESLERIIDNKDDQINALDKQLESVLLQIASMEAAGAGGDGIGTGNQGEESSWKLPGSEIKDSSKQLFMETHTQGGIFGGRDNIVDVKQGTAINLYNFSTTTSQTFYLSVSGDAIDFLRVPQSITIPARIGDTAGKGYVDVSWNSYIKKTSGKRNTTFSGYVEVKSSSGDSHRIRAEYTREIDRADFWGKDSSPRVHVGQEKT